MQTLEGKIEQIKELHRDLQLVGYLPIRLDNRTQVGHIALASLRDLYGDRVMDTTIRINTDLEKAAFARQTIFDLQGFGQWCRGLLCTRQKKSLASA